MPDANAPIAAEKEIDDSLPRGAEVVSDSDEMIGSLLARFGIGPELSEEKPSNEIVTPTPKEVAGDKLKVASEQPENLEPETVTPETPAAEAVVTPKGFTPEQEAEIAQRLEAKAKEFEPLAAERDELASAVEELQGKLAQLSSPAPLPKEIDPLLLEDDFNALSKKEIEVDQVLDWCDRYQDTGFEPDKEGEKSYSAYEVRRMKRQFETIKTATLPKAIQLANARAQKRTEARKAYPELFDGKSDSHKIRLGMKAKAPWLYAVFPQFDLWLGHMLEGEKAYAARTSKTTAAPVAPKLSVPPKPPTPPVLPSPGGAPLSTTNAGRKARAAGIDTNEFLSRGGNRDALISVLRESGIH